METKNPRLLVIVASTRPGRKGPVISDWFLEATSERAARTGVTLTVADLAEIDLPFLDEPEEPASGEYSHAHTRRWSRIVDDADGYVIVTPEYNHAMPATLKNAMDALAREWAHKPVAFVSYGNTSAGTRAAHSAKSVAATLGMVPITPTVAIRLTTSWEEGSLVRDEARDAAAVRMLNELRRYATMLAPLRIPDQIPVEDVAMDGLSLNRARAADAAELLVLQRACWVTEAVDNETLDIRALHEPLSVVAQGIRDHVTWVVRDGARIVGAVRGRASGRAWEIGRLMVAPDFRGRGLGRFLLGWAERNAPVGTRRLQLSTGAGSARNISIYSAAGYDLVGSADGVAHLARAMS